VVYLENPSPGLFPPILITPSTRLRLKTVPETSTTASNSLSQETAQAPARPKSLKNPLRRQPLPRPSALLQTFLLLPRVPPARCRRPSRKRKRLGVVLVSTISLRPSISTLLTMSYLDPTTQNDASTASTLSTTGADRPSATERDIAASDTAESGTPNSGTAGHSGSAVMGAIVGALLLAYY
jgi:hypothetical protein